MYLMDSQVFFSLTLFDIKVPFEDDVFFLFLSLSHHFSSNFNSAFRYKTYADNLQIYFDIKIENDYVYVHLP
jgi:hypothetical protein